MYVQYFFLLFSKFAQNLDISTNKQLSEQIATSNTASYNSNQTNVHRLLGFYQALAPLCIGGPSSTTLELELSGATKPNSSKNQQGTVENLK